MKKQLVITIAAGALGLMVAGCNQSGIVDHKLVATGGQHAIPLYPDEATFVKVSHQVQQGGVSGMIGNAEQGMSAKQIDDQTPVRVVSADNVCTEVEVTAGPMKGTAGCVANQNVD